MIFFISNNPLKSPTFISGHTDRSNWLATSQWGCGARAQVELGVCIEDGSIALELKQRWCPRRWFLWVFGANAANDPWTWSLCNKTHRKDYSASMNIMYNYEIKEGVNTLTEEKEGCWIIWSDSSRTNNILPKPEKW